MKRTFGELYESSDTLIHTGPKHNMINIQDKHAGIFVY